MFPVWVFGCKDVYLWAVFTKCFPSFCGDGKQNVKKNNKSYGIDNHNRYYIRPSREEGQR